MADPTIGIRKQGFWNNLVTTVTDGDVRFLLALIVTGLFVVTIVVALHFVWQLAFQEPGTAGLAATAIDPRVNQAKDILLTLISTETGILGSALGFYFGAKSSQKPE